MICNATQAPDSCWRVSFPCCCKSRLTHCKEPQPNNKLRHALGHISGLGWELLPASHLCCNQAPAPASVAARLCHCTVSQPNNNQHHTTELQVASATRLGAAAAAAAPELQPGPSPSLHRCRSDLPLLRHSQSRHWQLPSPPRCCCCCCLMVGYRLLLLLLLRCISVWCS